MSTILEIKEGSAEVIRIKNSPWDTSALPVNAYIVVDDGDSTTTVDIGNVANGQLANVNIDIPVFMEKTNIISGAYYPCEIIAGKDTDNPITFCSGDDLIIHLQQVTKLTAPE